MCVFQMLNLLINLVRLFSHFPPIFLFCEIVHLFCIKTFAIQESCSRYTVHQLTKSPFIIQLVYIAINMRVPRTD